MLIIPTPLLGWLALTSFVAFVAMGVDKMMAVGGHRRVSEKTLWLASLLGGFPGIFLGGFAFHHKTSKAEFWAPVAASALLWVVAIVALYGGRA